ncbi:MAG: hypothetical protein CMJ14_05640 [Pelagibacterales bacterium]|nr:hypothetical protein [Pelagibacterales bacterium]
MKSLPRIVAETEIDKPVNVKVWRNGQLMNLQVIVGEMKEEVQVSESKVNNNSEPVEVTELGLLVSSITVEVKEKFNIPNNVQGVIVLNVETNSDASKKGILPGDIISEVSQNQIFSPLDLQNRLQEEIKASRDFALLLINRKGNLSYIAVKINKN